MRPFVSLYAEKAPGAEVLGACKGNLKAQWYSSPEIHLVSRKLHRGVQGAHTAQTTISCREDVFVMRSPGVFCFKTQRWNFQVALQSLQATFGSLIACKIASNLHDGVFEGWKTFKTAPRLVLVDCEDWPSPHVTSKSPGS
jgi:hypothetical protein